jgi:hypothetical protein
MTQYILPFIAILGLGYLSFDVIQQLNAAEQYMAVLSN